MTPEEAHDLIIKLYKEILERDVDKIGYKTYLRALIIEGRDEEWLRNQLHNSPEHKRLMLQKRTTEMVESVKDLKIVGGMTTIPKRIDKIGPTIESIKKQIIPISKLYLTVPHKLQRTGEEYVIPDFITEDPFVEVVRSIDYGPICKLTGVIEAVEDPETIIVTFDDDVYYPPTVTKALISGMFLYPNAAYSVSAVHAKNNGNGKMQFNMKVYPGPTSILEGWAGAMYRRCFFENKDCFQLLPTMHHCFFSDDLMISNYLAKKGIPRIKVKNPGGVRVRETAMIDGLFLGANGLSYRTFKRYKLAAMELYFQKRLYL